MSQKYLFEIGLEEVPARFVKTSSKQLTDRVSNFLKDNHLNFEGIQTFATPRRFAVLVSGLDEKQEDQTEIFKGPARKIAQDEEGNWSKAAQGFVRGKGLTTDDIFFEDIKGVDYVHVKVETLGQPATEILKGITQVVQEMTFAVSMTWSDHRFSFIRPIHWFVSLLDDQVVDFTFEGVKAGRETLGHRFLGEKVAIDRAENYESLLEGQFVIANFNKRQEMIVNQFQAILDEKELSTIADQDLLDEVTALVEYPTAFLGTFDKKYLELPKEVLVTSMKNHQRYFETYDQEGKLATHFLGVRNGNDHSLDQVISGNEKVLVARLEDAVFFYNDDRKHSIDDYVAKLDKVTFHRDIGSMAEKMDRTGQISQLLIEVFADTDFSLELEDIDALNRASQIYKFDLVTGMVDEFSELQGIIGEYYALEAGESARVAQAIREHYMPIAAGADLPETKVGALLSIADKLDTIISFFQIGLVPTGSNDPFALRRQFNGLLAIINKYGLDLDMENLVTTLYEQIYQPMEQDLDRDQVIESFLDFYAGRLQSDLQARQVPADIASAVIKAKGYEPVLQNQVADYLVDFSANGQYKPAIEGLNRVINLAVKAGELADFIAGPVQEEYLETESERKLADQVQVLAGQDYDSEIEEFKAILALEPVISVFFEDNMVMADNPNQKNNRLNILVQLAKEILKFADTRELVIK